MCSFVPCSISGMWMWFILNPHWLHNIGWNDRQFFLKMHIEAFPHALMWHNEQNSTCKLFTGMSRGFTLFNQQNLFSLQWISSFDAFLIEMESMSAVNNINASDNVNHSFRNDWNLYTSICVSESCSAVIFLTFEISICYLKQNTFSVFT